MIWVVFLASIFITMAFTSVISLFADFISEDQAHEKEIGTLGDFFYNIGWMVGPALAGLLADLLGNTKSFTVLGLFGATAATILFLLDRKTKLGRV